jgi:hypothetical protein
MRSGSAKNRCEPSGSTWSTVVEAGNRLSGRITRLQHLNCPASLIEHCITSTIDIALICRPHGVLRIVVLYVIMLFAFLANALYAIEIDLASFKPRCARLLKRAKISSTNYLWAPRPACLPVRCMKINNYSWNRSTWRLYPSAADFLNLGVPTGLSFINCCRNFCLAAKCVLI